MLDRNSEYSMNMALMAEPLIEMDGRRLYYTFIAGARRVLEHQVELNKINVFPVNDGDTGTNLASTVRAVVDSLQPHKSYKITADRIAEATLENARGNSGIIFAQFLYGMSSETANVKTVTIREFAESVRNSVKYIYDAVSNPVEGTMLSVIKEWSNYIYDNSFRISDFNQMFINSFDVLSRAVSETRSKLAVLTKANVVDAGARGFELFIEGIIDFITRRDLKELIRIKSEAAIFQKIEEVIPEKVDLRFCTEALIRKCTLGADDLRKTLARYGDCVVVAGSDKLRRLHVHTNNPADLFDELRTSGTLAFQKADDMVRQSDAVYNRKWKIALVTDSTCDLQPELIDKYQVNMLPININFGENHYLDKITIQPEHFYKLLSESPDHPKTAQVNEKAFTNLYSHLASHYDSIIAIHLSDKLSGTFNSSRKAAEAISSEFGKPVTVINSRNVSGALGLVVLRAARAIEEGYSHEQIVSMANKWVNELKLLISVKTMKYLVKGGRVSAFKGTLARMLNINPVLSVDETGKIIVIDKAFNNRASMEDVMRHVSKLTRGTRLWNYIVLHCNNPEAASWYSSRMESLTGKEPLAILNISPVLGAHAGFGAAAVAILPE
ncbi:MAG TPA: DegV family protein [Bacteroidales bacterium]|nr:DegV family protein [Bacteroidales bacterium]